MFAFCFGPCGLGFVPLSTFPRAVQPFVTFNSPHHRRRLACRCFRLRPTLVSAAPAPPTPHDLFDATASFHGDQVQDEFSSWSSEFAHLCDEQLELLHTTVPDVASAAVFFRREHRESGSLEFVPLAAYPNDPRIWIAGAESTSRPTDSRVLAGGVPANRILPDYPFVSACDAQRGVVSPDGTLTVPIMFSTMVAGSVVLWRPVSVPPSRAWAERDVERVRLVARTIALAAVMEGRWIGAAREVRQESALLAALRDELRTVLHQIRSPITALITFGRLLLRKLPPGHASRGLAKSVIVTSLRLDDLLSPLDRASERTLPQADAEVAVDNGVDSADVDVVEEESGEEDTGAPVELGRVVQLGHVWDVGERGLLWVSDVLDPVVETYQGLAEGANRHFYSDVDDDTPPIFGLERNIREAVANCLDNALKYTSDGDCIGLYSSVNRNEPGSVEVIIWDTGPGVPLDERESVWEKGVRGHMAAESGKVGSGLGLHLVKTFVEEQDGTVELESPLSEELRVRVMQAGDQTACIRNRPGTAITIQLPRATFGKGDM